MHSYEVLHKVIHIASRTGLDCPRSFKGILRFLVKDLKLEEASLLLLDARQEIFFQEVKSSGSELFLPCNRKVGETPEGAALHRRQLVVQQGFFYFPVFNSRRNYGVLSLHTIPSNPLPEQLLDVLKTVCDELAILAQYGILSSEERRRVAQLTLLSDLGRELSQAYTLKDLLQAGDRTILRHSHAACVILRPIYGGDMPGRSYVRINSAYRGLRSFFLDLEGEDSAKVLLDEKPIYRRDLPKRRALPSFFPPAMVTMPLNFQDRVLGTLTLFGGKGDGIPLVFDSELKKFLAAIGSQIGHALERVMALERLEALSAENDCKLRETTFLYRISKAMHSTLRLNELIHLILSAATVSEGGGFERAMLFMINERSGILQGMLGVTRESAAMVLPPEKGALAWEHPVVSGEVQEAQRRNPFCRLVMKQRLPLDPDDNVIAFAARKEQVVFVRHPADESSSAAVLAEALKLAPYACVPLMGRDRPLGVLVVDNPKSREEITPDRLRFLELFANGAGGAMENSMLIHRLETAHQDLRETQERLIQGEKLAALGEMAASVFHELKNPLVSIGGFAQRLSRIAASESEEHEYTMIIAREVRRMEEMLTNILAFSKRHMLCFAECRISEIIEEALSLEADVLSRSSVRLIQEIASDLPIIQGDAQKLRQVIINLITNARQSMKDGGLLTIRSYRSSLRGDEAVAVEVEDTGGGIPDEIIRNIFNPFFTTKESGTGLGLSISHRIVEHHRGEFEVQNKEKGAVFILRLPVSVNKEPLY